MKTGQSRFRSLKPARAGLIAAVFFSFASSSMLSSWARAQDDVWGAATNSVRLGVRGYRDSGLGFARPPICILSIQNTSSNFMGICLPPAERRYHLDLRGTDGKAVGRTGDGRVSDRPGVLRKMCHPGVSYQADAFFLPDVFNVRSNGTYTLIASGWVSVATNYPWFRKSNYFKLPAVTNVFQIKLDKSD